MGGGRHYSLLYKLSVLTLKIEIYLHNMLYLPFLWNKGNENCYVIAFYALKEKRIHDPTI